MLIFMLIQILNINAITKRNSFKIFSSSHKLYNCLRLSTMQSINFDKVAVRDLLSLEDWADSASNTWLRYMRSDFDQPESIELQLNPRQVYKCHFTYAKIETPKQSHLIATSECCAADIGLNPAELKNPKFLDLLIGKKYIKGLDQPYSTIYGCYSYGQWFGQLGDGRAMALGEVQGKTSTYEIQMKGCGRSPFSRGFDGKAVLRSSIREYLASEAMHHLGVPTTRALALIGTNETVYRPWYGDTSIRRDSSTSRKIKYPPNMMLAEKGAMLCRVSRSFLRLTHVDLFIKRSENVELMEMIDYICLREYPHILNIDSYSISNLMNVGIRSVVDIGLPERYIQLYKEVSYNNANLVALWQSVGYVQGNMNSDNTLFAGRTIDYGPFGWLEKYDPFYQPFTSDPSGNFAYIRQPAAMGINIAVLGESFKTIIEQSCKYHNIDDVGKYVIQINEIKEKLFQEYFFQCYNKIRSNKLGLKDFDTINDESLWKQLELLMYRSNCDYIIFFRLLSRIAISRDVEVAYDLVASSFYETKKDGPNTNNKIVTKEEWIEWITNYHKRLNNDSLSTEERTIIQNKSNPKFVLRNWMSVLAYEKADEGDYSVLNEIAKLLEKPYDDQTEEMTKKWFIKTPDWASELPGCTFMSCSS